MDAVRQYEPPEYKETASGSYIEFHAYDPEQGKMRRKRIKLNHIKVKTKRREHARGMIKRINEQLSRGWNPWIAKDTEDLQLFEDALTRYENHIEKMIANGYFRKETYSGYKSNIKILREYIEKKRPLYYVYQFDKKFCNDFLDYVFIGRDNGAQTRNNYLNFLRVLSGFFVEKGFLTVKPTDGILPISKRLYQKERACIPSDKIAEIADYCRKNDPHFLLACYLLFYGFVRPVEMTRLKIKFFSLKDSTLTIPAECSKNKTTQTVTLPKKVILLGVELGVFSAPMEDYLFSTKLRPGPEEIDTKIFRDHWNKLRKALNFKKEWQFYSLKDTGITEMVDTDITPRQVKAQARHSSLAITDIYLERSAAGRHGDQQIIEYDGSL